MGREGSAQTRFLDCQSQSLPGDRALGMGLGVLPALRCFKTQASWEPRPTGSLWPGLLRPKLTSPLRCVLTFTNLSQNCCWPCTLSSAHP